MAIFSDLELERIMNEAKSSKNDDDFDSDEALDSDQVKASKGQSSSQSRIKNNANDMKNAKDKASNNLKKNLWFNRHKDKKSGAKKITFKEDADGNIIDCIYDGEALNEKKSLISIDVNSSDNPIKKRKYEEEHETRLGNNIYRKSSTKEEKDANKYKRREDYETKVRNLSIKSAIELEKEKQDWEQNPGAKTGEAIGNAVTGGNIVNTIGKKSGKFLGSTVDKVIDRANSRRKKIKEDAEMNMPIYRTPEFTKAMNEFFDITDHETRKILLAVNESDQNKVLVSLTSKLYDNVVDKVDDIDFGEIEMTKGDIQKLPNYNTLTDCLNNMSKLLIEFKQDVKPVDTIAECVSNMIDSKDIWTKAYGINCELPMITYNTMVLAIIEATGYLVSMCVEFIKSPSQDTIQIMIDKSALTKSKGHMLFKNIEAFNDAYRKGQVTKAMTHVLDETAAKKNFVGLTGIGIGAAVVGVAGLLFCIIPIIRELIFLFFFYRVKISEFFEVQADLLQVNAYNIENNRLDLSKEERKKISGKQMKVADKFRKVAKTIAIDAATAEKSASKAVKEESKKKYKAEEIMDEVPDSAGSALF